MFYIYFFIYITLNAQLVFHNVHHWFVYVQWNGKNVQWYYSLDINYYAHYYMYTTYWFHVIMDESGYTQANYVWIRLWCIDSQFNNLDM